MFKTVPVLYRKERRKGQEYIGKYRRLYFHNHNRIITVLSSIKLALRPCNSQLKA